MEIIDFERKGNLVRFYLGDSTKEYWGDDWDDSPYEHNAGPVYDRYIQGHKDIAFDFDDVVLEPCCGEYNSYWSKQDMVDRLVPCIIVIPKKVIEADSLYVMSFADALKTDGVIKYYFGDKLDEKN